MALKLSQRKILAEMADKVWLYRAIERGLEKPSKPYMVVDGERLDMTLQQAMQVLQSHWATLEAQAAAYEVVIDE